ncbi:MAG: hypothetical protein KAJ75_00295, partial [Alphaproteobacteria bacterium]|nr:hypothetical protein [Alphaproteobacteria bacterium]
AYLEGANLEVAKLDGADFTNVKTSTPEIRQKLQEKAKKADDVAKIANAQSMIKAASISNKQR